MSDETPKTLSVPEAGKKYFGLSRNGSYDAAKRGDIPTIAIGRLKPVSVSAMERMVNPVPTMDRRVYTRDDADTGA